MTSKDDGGFTIRLNATKMLHFASISSTAAENVLDVLELIINDKPVEEWKGLLVPQGEIVIQGGFKEKTVDPAQSMRLSPTMVLEDEKGNPFDLQFTTQRKRQEGFNVFNLLSTTRKGAANEKRNAFDLLGLMFLTLTIVELPWEGLVWGFIMIGSASVRGWDVNDIQSQ